VLDRDIERVCQRRDGFNTIGRSSGTSTDGEERPTCVRELLSGSGKRIGVIHGCLFGTRRRWGRLNGRREKVTRDTEPNGSIRCRECDLYPPIDSLSESFGIVDSHVLFCHVVEGLGIDFIDRVSPER
jgi:hypothetical protein